MKRLCIYAILSTIINRGKKLNRLLLLVITGWIIMAVNISGAESAAFRGYIGHLPTESKSEREQRHKLVTERRSGTIVTVHRGASAFAPENTLEAYAAAMDYSADGCEIDIRRTADGILVLFHDDMLDRLTDGFGTLNQLTYAELLSLHPRYIYGAATKDTRPPTLAAVLTLARQRAMLLHLDIKEPGIEEDIIKMLDEADMWDHVVSVSPYNSEQIQKHPQFKPLQYKAPGLFEDRTDMDLEGVKAALAKPGEMIIVDDPRVAAQVLGRVPYKPVPLPRLMTTFWVLQPVTSSTGFVPQHFLKTISSTDTGKLLDIVNSSSEDRTKLDGDDEYQHKRLEGIIARAWAVRQLSQTTPRPDGLTQLLIKQAQTRSLHKEWLYHGLDGASAVRALAEIGAVESVPTLIKLFKETDPHLEKVKMGNNPLGWADWRIKSSIIEALGKLSCKESKDFLVWYVTLDQDKAREMCFPMYGEAAKSLMKQELTVEEIESLLKHSQPQVRGEALLYCIDHPSEERTEAIRKVALWALELPQAGQR